MREFVEETKDHKKNHHPAEDPIVVAHLFTCNIMYTYDENEQC